MNVLSGTGNAIRHNSIFANGTTIQHLGIDLGTSGVTANDPNPSGCPAGDDTGANNLQNFPVITSAVNIAGGGIRIEGMLNSAANTTFDLDFFANPSCDVAGNGEGQTFIGSATVATGSNCIAGLAIPGVMRLALVSSTIYIGTFGAGILQRQF